MPDHHYIDGGHIVLEEMAKISDFQGLAPALKSGECVVAFSNPAEISHLSTAIATYSVHFRSTEAGSAVGPASDSTLDRKAEKAPNRDRWPLRCSVVTSGPGVVPTPILKLVGKVYGGGSAGAVGRAVYEGGVSESFMVKSCSVYRHAEPPGQLYLYSTPALTCFKFGE
jgi:hypothetical protein